MPAFRVGQFEVHVSRRQGRWAVSIDGLDLPRWFMTEAQAAGGGLVEAQRLGRASPGAGADVGTGGREAAPIEA
jgi:hypothetical protein